MTDNFGTNAELGDSQLIERILERDELAFQTLVTRHAHRLARIASQTLGDVGTREDVEEVVSDTFFKVWTASHAYEPERAAVTTWLSWLTVGQALQRRRQLRRLQSSPVRRSEVPVEEVADGQFDEEVNSEIDAMHQFELVLRQMQELSPSDAELIRRRYFLNQSSRESALDLGISESAARVRLFRAMQKLRRILESDPDFNKGGA